MTQPEHAGSNSIYDDEAVDLLVRKAVRTTDGDVARMDLAAGYTELLDNVLLADACALTRDDAWTKPRRSKKVIATSALAAGVLATTGGLAVAGKLSIYDLCRHVGGACTGQYLPAASAPADRSQQLDIWASNYPAVVERIANTQHAPWAPGYSEPQYVRLLIRTQRTTDLNDGPAADYASITGVAASLATAASCSWQQLWLRSYAEHDHSKMAESAKMIRQAAHSPIMKLVDAAAFQSSVANAAERGDAEAVRRSTSMSCSSL